MRGVFVLFAFALIAAPGTAHAGRTYYGWLYGTEVMPERGAELQTWVSEENRGAAQSDSHETNWWLGPLIGVTDQLEIALPVEMSWSRSDVAPAKFTFDRYGVEARYRLVSQDPVDAPPLVPLVRVAVKRIVGQRDTIRPEADFVTSYQDGSFHGLVDIGFIGEINANDHHFELHPGAGVSLQAIGDLRFGAEVYAELSLDSKADSWVVAGPDLAWTHGRFWLSATFGIGLYQIKDAPRVQWGLAF